MKSTMATRVTARDKDFLVERLCEGVVIDLYTTKDLKEPHRNRAAWIQCVAEWFAGQQKAEEVSK